MKKVLKWLLAILVIILLDQITKGYLLYLITGSVPVSGPAWTVVPVPYMMANVTDFFNIVFTWNPGTAFSLFRALGEASPYIMVGITLVITLMLFLYLVHRAESYERVPLIFIIGGALGNLVDRVRFGAVIDFLDFHIGAHHWPSFNVADIFICVGIGLFVLNWILARRRCLKNVKG